MSEELLKRLRSANPVPDSVVSTLQARLWGQTLAPPAKPTRRPWARRHVVAVVLAVAALLAAPALAFRFGVIDFSTAPTAPPKIVEDFSSLSVGAPRGMDPRVLAGQTRLVGNAVGHRLWVAPTKAGGLCYMWSGASGGCDTLGTVPLDVTWSGTTTTAAAPVASFPAVDGFVRSRWVDDVQITLDDGTTVQPEVLWVSPPISAGFFFYRAPVGHMIAAVRALRRGTVVAADEGGNGAQGPHPFADLTKKTKIAAVQTNAGAATLWTDRKSVV